MLRRWDPWRELFGIKDEIDRILDRWLSMSPISAVEEEFERTPFRWAPATDVYETENELVVKAELPGISAKDIDITLTDDYLTIKGEKKQDEEVKSENYYRRESSYGMFKRTIPLPVKVKKDDIKATFKDGVLEIRVPKEKAEGKEIKIEVKEE